MAKSKLPDAARVLPPAGQGVWLKAFDEAKLKGLPDDEASAFAWSAVKRAGYHKLANGKWGKMLDTQLVIEDDSFHLGVPFVKINAKKREVSGFATLDNVDQAGELLDADASVEAFKKWAGNIREMHEHVAVGKALEVVEKEYSDESGDSFKGVWITARISKGAEDTWQKVLDGTLCGFSVGGAVHEKERSIVKMGDVEREVWRITKYSLNEVSLVDNPCNQLALVSLVKSVDGSLTFEDIVDDAEEPLEKAHMPGGNECCMEEIDAALKSLSTWRARVIEKESDNEVAEISRIMAHVRTWKNMEQYDHDDHERMVNHVNKINESEGETMTKTGEELQDKEISDNSVTEDLTDEHKSLIRKFAEFVLGEKEVPSTEEVTKEVEEDLTKEGVSSMQEEEVTALVEGAKEELTKSVDGKFTELGEALTKIAEALDAVAKTEALTELKTELEGSVTALTDRIEALETSGAVKKSGDVDSAESLEKEEKGLWSDSIVPEFLKKQVS